MQTSSVMSLMHVALLLLNHENLPGSSFYIAHHAFPIGLALTL